ncbi:glycosyltransferase family 4 protein [Pelagibacteraceae bacterium]|jgi:glycosyltransferase involved in cell wall biosynthesis|nr:glycosyltransferase family 4 protein [Pelagibacteraceae bacterium]MDB9742951.1 glycosyltransferase family 4 protein [Pelagibacteraceae bacterium]MDC0339461.1 glycosyltransferase family 4 protein [Pelagibacteraceae bacterium]MDC0366171.1 glycosyltransferase family 4 protein [Pelagibacteraceae bacterium]|tara:strand:- start:1140 stop:2297 length:1158 start_codon:yes stop_codon:yes gene_type:complete
MTTKIKVLQVIPKLGYGGAETGCYDIAHYLSEKNCSSFIATSGGKLLKFVKRNKVKIFRLPVHSKNPILIIFNTIILSILILVNNINIVHARSRAPAWSCYLACLITRRHFITTFHGTYNYKTYLKKFYNSVMLKSKLTIAGSNFIFNHITENYNNFLHSKKKLRVIYRGINLEYYNQKNISILKMENLKKEWEISANKFTILLPGRLTSWKGQEKFIESLNILIEDYNVSNFQAIVLGSDQGRKVYKKKLINLVQRYRLGQKVKFIDHCKEMPVAYSLADIVISASIEPEAFGRVSVEAQAMGKPIIASNLGGSKETILDGKSGFLYKHDDPRELAKSLNAVIELDQDHLNSIGNEGRKNVIKKFDVELMCDSTLREYKKLLNI